MTDPDAIVPDADEDPESDDSFETRVMQSMFDIFWEPEIERRGGMDTLDGFHAALAILPPGGPVEIRLNDEVHLVASARVNSPVKSGDPITADNIDFIERVEPAEIDPEAAWAVYAVLPTGQAYLSFDFRRYKGRAQGMVERSHEFLETASEALAGGRLASAIESLHASAELSVTAMMILQNTDAKLQKRNSHQHRLSWIDNFTYRENAPRDFHAAMKLLGKWRPRARYFEVPSGGLPELPSRDEVQAVRDIVEEMLQHARVRCSAGVGRVDETPATGLEGC